MIRTFIFSLIIFVPLLLKSEYIWEYSLAEPALQRGIESLYNYKFDDAISILDSAIKLDISHPVPPFVLISAKWLKAQMQIGYMASYDTIRQEVEKTIPIYKKLLINKPDDPELLLYLGSTYGMRARTALANKEWFDVLYFGYQGLNYIKKGQDLDKNLLDLNMPIGLMEYFSCLSSPAIQLGAKIAGISPNCQQGLNHLSIAANKSRYSWIEASNVLTYAYLHIERDFIKADYYISRLTDKFPEHPFFALLKGELLAKAERWESLDSLLPKLEKFANFGSELQKNESKIKLEYIYALKAFYNKDYSLSIEKCNWIIDNYDMEFDWLKGFVYLLRGKNFDLLENRILAVNDYNNVLKMDQFYPEVDEAKFYLKTPFSL